MIGSLKKKIRPNNQRQQSILISINELIPINIFMDNSIIVGPFIYFDNVTNTPYILF